MNQILGLKLDDLTTLDEARTPTAVKGGSFKWSALSWMIYWHLTGPSKVFVYCRVMCLYRVMSHRYYGLSKYTVYLPWGWLILWVHVCKNASVMFGVWAMVDPTGGDLL